MRRAMTALSAALIMGTSSLAPAQTVTGTILGVVSDTGGGVISQAHVTITEENTGRKRELVTDNLGEYLATFLPVGTYTVAVEKSGFRKATFTGTVLQVDQQNRHQS